MTIYLLDGTLQIDIFYDCEDQDLEDNVCIRVIERCPPTERLLRAGQTHIYLTPEQARELGDALLEAAQHSESDLED
ncbi:MAG: hypothetical protein ACOCYU_02560 [Brevefilum sp.]